MSTASNPAPHPVVSSALWAAWGDALGFITELTPSISEVTRRSGGAKVENTVRWSRRIGGRFGPMVALPAGTYSDDTQLRLSVSRSIRSDGRFDLEAFSKVELPVFLSYEMRAGKGTKAAAYELMRRHVRWSSNFFDNDRARYVEAGGNGAAMRIQPHVWSTPGFDPRQFLNYIVADAIVTHGHPRGVVGAVVHANALSSVLRHGHVPRPEIWDQIVDYGSSIPDVMQRHEALRERWLPTWEKASGRRWSEAVMQTIAEGKEMVATARKATDSRDPVGAYGEALNQLGGRKRDTVGSGMIAAIASLLAAWLFREDAANGLRAIANLLGSDTDTIGTLSGALLGASGLAAPPGPILDQDYITAEAKRMLAIGEGREAANFPHPDTLKWKPPSTLADAVGGIGDGRIAVAGLGPVSETGEEYAADGRGTLYQWMTLSLGQTLLIKRRPQPKDLPPSSLPVERPARSSNGNGALSLFDPSLPATDARSGPPPAAGEVDLQHALDAVVSAGFDERVVGRELLRFARLAEKSYERASDFAAAVTTAYRSKGNTGPAPDS